MGEDDQRFGFVGISIAIAIIMVFAIGMFIQSMVDDHREKSLRVFDLTKEYRLSLRQTNFQFSRRWNEYLKDSADPDDPIDPYDRRDLDQNAYGALVDRFLEMDSNRDNYEALAAFYDSVGECVRESLCDFRLARTMFGYDILTFYNSMYPALAAQNQRGRSDAGIVDFVERMRAEDRGDTQLGWEDRLIAWAY